MRPTALAHPAGAVSRSRFSSGEPSPATVYDAAYRELPTFYATLTPDYLRSDLWAGIDPGPALIAASACWDGRALRSRPFPASESPRMCDSGGFWFAVGRRGAARPYPFGPSAYRRWLAAMEPDIAATLDLPCEAEVAENDTAIAWRQAWTLGMAGALLSGPPAPWAWMPVLQGRTPAHYRAHARAYRAAGLVQPLMGIGSLCRRGSVRAIHQIVRAVAAELPGTRFHLFGVKLGLASGRLALHPAIASFDSGAWNSRFGSDIPAFNVVMAERGWSQRETAVRWALPRYRAKVAAALRRPKQCS